MSSTSTTDTFPTVQGAQSTTFSTPPLDGNLTVPDLLAFHAENSGTHHFFTYEDSGRLNHITHAMAFRAQIKAAAIIKSRRKAGSEPYTPRGTRPVFGMLANADTITFATMMFGIQHTGAVPFLISTRNSPTAVSHLLRSTATEWLFVSEDSALRALAAEAIRLLAEDGHCVALLDIPRFETLFDESTRMPTDFCIAPPSVDSPALILHSSGTSAFPKPIMLTHRNYISWGMAPYFGEIDICAIRLGVQSLPMFHALGVFVLILATCCGIELATFKPARPPTVPGPTSVYQGLLQTECEWVLTVPTFIEEWSREASNVRTLATSVKRILFGGGPLNKQIGDALHARGIFLQGIYGSTEGGCLSKLLSEASRISDWEYFQFPDRAFLAVELLPYGNPGNLLQPVLMAGRHTRPATINTALCGVPGFETGDLVQEHPQFEGYYKIFGRADEQIMLSTGEKTNPVPLERILQQDPHIHVAIFFGRGRFNNGVLVQPTRPVNVQDVNEVAEFRDAVWSTFTLMNGYAPSHSRVLKEMLLIAKSEKPLELTAKGTVRRNTSLERYADEIEEIYRAAGESAISGLAPPETWSTESTDRFVQLAVDTVMDREIGRDEDLFAAGCDSLLAMSIRTNIVRALNKSAATSSWARQIPQSVVYQHPSSRALSNYVFAALTGLDFDSRGDAETVVQDRVRAMETMVAKYSAGLPKLTGSQVSARYDIRVQTVLITGTTGRFGCHILAQLIEDPRVAHIFALNRSSPGATPSNSGSVRKRMSAAFESWGLDPILLRSAKVTWLECDYAAPHLGLVASVYAKIKSHVTTIIHNAWRVDFNLELSSFEPLIAGVRRLIELAAGASVIGGARILFVSSISVLFGTGSDREALEKPLTDARVSQGMGYAESKWVAETLLFRARDEVGLRTAVVRVGQLAGDTRVGGWNKQEWVGAIARAGQIVGALPDRDEQVSWVPVNTAAAALIDMTRADGSVFHLVAPKPSSWHTVFGTFSAQLDLLLVSFQEWVTRVVDAAETNTRDKDVQPLALADFFRTGDFGEQVKISTSSARAASSRLANMPPIAERDARLYLDFWKRIGHLEG
ncbi:acetyl-CoA synthetase-like protein [Peniophora sp. CONT]|nr:acetyl-CoA synthetase-like protein [Peniophora sp. CONT]